MGASPIKNTEIISSSVLYLSVALVSASGLMLEITLTRMFSILFDYHFAFLLISFSILGLGTGGMTVLKLQKLSQKIFYRIALPASSGLMALSILFMTVSILKIPAFQRSVWVLILTVIPFFFAGIFISAVFRLVPEKSHRLYAADLMGASLGTILALILLKLGVINAHLVVAMVALTPMILLAWFSGSNPAQKLVPIVVISGLVILLFVNVKFDLLGVVPFGQLGTKDMYHMMSRSPGKTRIIDTKWSAFGRTDLVMDETTPDYRVLFVDGVAGSVMFRYDGNIESLRIPTFLDAPEYFPFELTPDEKKKKVLIIGSGGGREILTALLGGAEEITAVEVNRDLVNLVKKYSDYNGRIYSGLEKTKVLVGEGRNFIRRSKELYDIIMLTQPVTRTARGPDGFALAENFLFTVESINDYLDHLQPDGQLSVVTHGAGETLRLIMTALAALETRGIDTSSAMKHIYSLGPEASPLFVLKKSPFTENEAEKIHLKMHELNFDNELAFIPFIKQQQHKSLLSDGTEYYHYMLNAVLYLLSQGLVTPEDIIEASNADIRSVTDNNPFFYKFSLGLPRVVKLALIISGIALAIGMLIRPGSRPPKKDRPARFRCLILFSLLGVGFMLIEIPLIQKFTLFLGQPVYAMAVLLFSLLAGVGLGSLTSGHFWKSGTVLKLQAASMMVAVLVLLFIPLLDHVFNLFLGSSLSLRTAISFFMLAPLGFFMGMPFPLGLKSLEELGFTQYVPKMWGINGLGSVLGSALAIALAISYGFSYALFLGAALYVSIALIHAFRFQTVKLGLNYLKNL